MFRVAASSDVSTPLGSGQQIRAMCLTQFSHYGFDELNCSNPMSAIDEEVAETFYHQISTGAISVPDMADLNAIFYVSGALVNLEMDMRRNCASCKNLLVMDGSILSCI